jgi:DNA-binding NarL/FixJ family response regulator
MPEVRVMVVDDQEIFRSVLRELVAATEGFVLAGEATSGESALAAMNGENGPDLVVMDALMEGMGGIAAAGEMVRRDPDRVVLLVSVLDVNDPEAIAGGRKRIAFVPKQDLRPQVLRDVWEIHKPNTSRTHSP